MAPSNRALEPWTLPSMEDHLDGLAVEGPADALDIGCGDGWFVRRLINLGSDATGVECGTEMLRRARQSDPTHANRYLDAVGQDLPFGDDSFDVVFFVFSLHHVPARSMRDALREAARVVRIGGVVHVVEPVAQGLGHDVDALVDDETHVRALAQAAVDEIMPALFEESAPAALTMGTAYADFDDYEQLLVGIDPDRAAAIAANRESVKQAFYTNAVGHDDRWWFEDHLLIRTFR